MRTGSKTYELIVISLFAVLMAVCSWLSIPTAVPFTMQTFGLFLTLDVLGGKRGTAAVSVYILLGALGLPVFSGFTGGLGILLGNTGGYILGFICSSLVYWGMENALGAKPWVNLTAMILGLVACYFFGMVWFMAVYAKTTGAAGIWTVLSWCVFPFIVPDLMKMGMALLIGKRVKKIIGFLPQ